MRFIIICAALVSVAHADKAKAREFYEQGIKQFNMGEYEPALGAFKRAYDELPDAVFLFNSAQCYRQLGDKPKAALLYRSFLHEQPDAPNADQVRRLIATLEADVMREQATKRQPPAGVEPPAAAPALTAPAIAAKASPEARQRSWWRNPPGWAVGGTGLVVALVGAGLAGGAVATENDARTASTLQAQRDLHIRANQLEPAGWVMIGIGGAGVVAGVALLAAGGRHAESR